MLSLCNAQVEIRVSFRPSILSAKYELSPISSDYEDYYITKQSNGPWIAAQGMEFELSTKLFRKMYGNISYSTINHESSLEIYYKAKEIENNDFLREQSSSYVIYSKYKFLNFAVEKRFFKNEILFINLGLGITMINISEIQTITLSRFKDKQDLSTSTIPAEQYSGNANTNIKIGGRFGKGKMSFLPTIGLRYLGNGYDIGQLYGKAEIKHTFYEFGLGVCVKI